MFKTVTLKDGDPGRRARPEVDRVPARLAACLGTKVAAMLGGLVLALLASVAILPVRTALSQSAAEAPSGPGGSGSVVPDPGSDPAIDVDRELAHLREQVRRSEQDIATFRAAHDPASTGQTPPSASTELAKAKADAAEKRAKIQQITRLKADGTNLDTVPEILHSPIITQLRGRQAELNRRDSDLSAMYGSAYPALAQVRAQRASLQRAIDAEIKRLIAALKSDYEIAKARELALSAKSTPDVDGTPPAGAVKPSDLTPDPSGPVQVLPVAEPEPAKTAPAAAASDSRPQAEADAPLPPHKPVSSLLGIVSGLGIGLVAGAALAILVLGRRRVVAPPPRLLRDRAPASTPTPGNPFILGRIPAVGPSGGTADLSAYLASRPDSDFARSIEALVAKLATADKGDGLIVALSPLSLGEGTTSIAACLAQAAGQAGKRVLLIDADPKDPNLSSLLEAAARPGLAEVIDDAISASKAVVRRPHFAFLPVGQRALAIGGAPKALRAFLAETRRRFDLVLIDTPAFDAGPEAKTISALCDSFALVASWDRLMRHPFVAAIDAVADAPGFAGLILNRTLVADAEERALAS